MNLNDMLVKTYIMIDEKKKPTTDTIIKDGINYAYKKIAKEKFKKVVADLSLVTDEPDLPEIIDRTILCFFAAYYFFKVDGDESGKSTTWINMFIDGFDNIDGEINDNENEVVTDVYSTEGTIS